MQAQHSLHDALALHASRWRMSPALCSYAQGFSLPDYAVGLCGRPDRSDCLKSLRYGVEQEMDPRATGHEASASRRTPLERDDPFLHKVVEDAQGIHPRHPARVYDRFESGRSVDKR